MPDRRRERQPDEASQDQSLVRAVESAFAAINSLGRRIRNGMRKGYVILIFVVMVSAGSGAAVNHVFEKSKPVSIADPDPGAGVLAVELGTLKMTEGSMTFGVITGAIIDSVRDKEDNINKKKEESDGTAHPDAINRVTVKFRRPDSCAGECIVWIEYLLGDKGLGSCNPMCKAEFKNVDQSNEFIGGKGRVGKTDTSDVQSDLRDYEETKRKVTILFDGRRDSKKSKYPNILRVMPSGDERFQGDGSDAGAR